MNRSSLRIGFSIRQAALVKVQNNTLRAVDENKSVILLLLDLSAAFDTVDHSILLSRLSHRFGIKETVLTWFKSYLTSRKQFVQVQGSKSTQRSLKCGVPQGSILGPLLYVLYSAPIADIIRRHNLQYHIFADNIHLYISFKLDSYQDLQSAKAKVQLGVRDIECCMDGT